MTVILVLLTFATFLLIDHFYSERKVVVQPALSAAKREPQVRPVPSLVGGFKVPENLRYHPGHTWALNEGPSLVRVGLDDFASKLMGKVERIQLPQRGQWIRQGQKIATIYRDGAAVDMVSPIEGSVADVNDTLASDSQAGAQGSLRRRLVDHRAVPRCQDQLPQLARWRDGAVVDGRVGGPLAEKDASTGRRNGAGRRRGDGQPDRSDSGSGMGNDREGVLPLLGLAAARCGALANGPPDIHRPGTFPGGCFLGPFSARSSQRFLGRWRR